MVKVRYLVAKKQKGHVIYYWQPTKKLIATGNFLPMRLASRTNRLEDAIVEAEKYNKELDDWRMTGVFKGEKLKDTIGWLIEKYQGSQWYKKLAPKTQRGYDHWMKHLNTAVGDLPIKAMTRAACKAYYNKLSETSLHNGNAALRFIRLLFSFAVDEGIMTDNPAKGIRLIGTEARQQLWEHDQIKALVDRALADKRRSIALAVKLGEHLGQREGDILSMQWSQYNGKTIKIRQRKTDAFIEIPCSKELKHWLDNTEKNSTHIVVSEVTLQPYKEDNFQHIFSAIRNAAKIKDKWFMDLRRTAIVRLAEAGCTVPEITAISGHKADVCQKILETYMPRSSIMASNAIDKIEKHRKEKLELKIGSDK